MVWVTWGNVLQDERVISKHKWTTNFLNKSYLKLMSILFDICGQGCARVLYLGRDFSLTGNGVKGR